MSEAVAGERVTCDLSERECLVGAPGSGVCVDCCPWCGEKIEFEITDAWKEIPPHVQYVPPEIEKLPSIPDAKKTCENCLHFFSVAPRDETEPLGHCAISNPNSLMQSVVWGSNSCGKWEGNRGARP